MQSISFTVHILAVMDDPTKYRFNEPTVDGVLQMMAKGECTIEVPSIYINDPVIKVIQNTTKTHDQLPPNK